MSWSESPKTKMPVVTERDLRMPEFRDSDLGDLEFREDGKIVRKDRWEVCVRKIAGTLHERGLIAQDFEVDDVAEAVSEIIARHESE